MQFERDLFFPNYLNKRIKNICLKMIIFWTDQRNFKLETQNPSDMNTCNAAGNASRRRLKSVLVEIDYLCMSTHTVNVDIDEVFFA